MKNKAVVFQKEVYLGHNRQAFSKIRNYKSISVPLHFHEYYEMEFIVSGTGTSALNGSCVELEPGMMFFLTPVDYHDYSFNDVVTYNVSFTEEIYNKLFDSEKSGSLVTMFKLDEQSISSVRNIYEALIDLGNRNIDFAVCAMKALVSLYPKKSEGKGQSNSGKSYASKASGYIRTHFREDINISDIAKHCGLSVDYTRRIFLEQYGVTPTEFIRKIRLDYAAKLLKTTDLSVTEIAMGCGFQSLSSFNRAFKEHFKRCPAKFR